MLRKLSQILALAFIDVATPVDVEDISRDVCINNFVDTSFGTKIYTTTFKITTPKPHQLSFTFFIRPCYRLHR